VVGGALERDSGFDEAAKGVGEIGAGGVKDGEVVEAGGAGRGGMAVGAFPGVQPDMLVVSAGGDEGGRAAHLLHELESEDAAVEIEGAGERGDFEVHVSNASAGGDARAGHAELDETRGGMVIFYG